MTGEDVFAARQERKGFHIRTVQGGVIRCLFDVLKDLLNDAVLVVDSTGIKITAMDQASCILVHMKLAAEAFEEYTCDADPLRPYEIGINTANMFKLIQSAGGRDAIAFTYSMEREHELGITIQNYDRCSTTRFSMKLIDLDYEEIELDDVDFDSRVTMPSKYFLRLCRDMSDISNFMRIQSQNGTITLGCDGDIASQRTVLGVTESDPDVQWEWQEGATFDSLFSLKYLLTICKSTGLCPTVELYMKHDYPLIVLYKIAALGTLKICLVDKLSD